MPAHEILENQGNKSPTHDISTIKVSSVSNYSIRVNVGGVWVSFTGAAVSLIDGKVWNNITQLKDK